MDRLSNTTVYLLGQVESDPNAHSWRIDMTHWLHALSKSIKVWDPLVKASWMNQFSKSPTIPFNTDIYTGNGVLSQSSLDMWDANTEIRSVCRSLINNCDWVMARLQKSFTWGSIDELEIAINRKIPIFLWLPDGPIGTYGLPGLVSNPTLINAYIHLEKQSLLNIVEQVHTGSYDLPALDPQRWIKLTYPDAVNKHVYAII